MASSLDKISAGAKEEILGEENNPLASGYSFIQTELNEAAPDLVNKMSPQELKDLAGAIGKRPDLRQALLDGINVAAKTGQSQEQAVIYKLKTFGLSPIEKIQESFGAEEINFPFGEFKAGKLFKRGQPLISSTTPQEAISTRISTIKPSTTELEEWAQQAEDGRIKKEAEEMAVSLPKMEVKTERGTLAPTAETPPGGEPPKPPETETDRLFAAIKKMSEDRSGLVKSLQVESEGVNAALQQAREDYLSEVQEAKTEFEKEKTAARWGEIAELVGRNLTALAAAYRQAKTGREYMQGVDTRAQVNWMGNVQQARQELQSAIQLARDKRDLSADQLSRESKTRADALKGEYEAKEMVGLEGIRNIREKLETEKRTQLWREQESERDANAARREAERQAQESRSQAFSAKKQGVTAEMQNISSGLKQIDKEEKDIETLLNAVASSKSTDENRAQALIELEALVLQHNPKSRISNLLSKATKPLGIGSPEYTDEISPEDFVQIKNEVNLSLKPVFDKKREELKQGRIKAAQSLGEGSEKPTRDTASYVTIKGATSEIETVGGRKGVRDSKGNFLTLEELEKLGLTTYN